jgi:hypothetical protein
MYPAGWDFNHLGRDDFHVVPNSNSIWDMVESVPSARSARDFIA